MKNSLLLFLLILALAGDIVLAYLLYDCMHDRGLNDETAAPCTGIVTTGRTNIMTSWDNFNKLDNASNENYGILCRDALLRIFSDTSVNALALFMCSDNDDPSKQHAYSIGIAGVKMVEGTAPGQGEIIIHASADFYQCDPWCPYDCCSITTRD